MGLGYQYSLGLTAIKDVTIKDSKHSITIILSKSDTFDDLVGIYIEDGYKIQLKNLHIFRIFQAFESLMSEKKLIVKFDDGELFSKEQCIEAH